MAWFVLDRVDLSYVATAPHHVCQEVVLNAPPENAFEALTGDRWLEWFPELKDIKWNPPRGVGGTRFVRLRHAEVHETFLAWEPARRLAFSVDRSTLPVITALLVDFQLTPVLDGRCARITLSWHYDIRGWMRPFRSLVHREFQKIVFAALVGLKTFVEERGSHDGGPHMDTGDIAHGTAPGRTTGSVIGGGPARYLASALATREGVGVTRLVSATHPDAEASEGDLPIGGLQRLAKALGVPVRGGGHDGPKTRRS